MITSYATPYRLSSRRLQQKLNQPSKKLQRQNRFTRELKELNEATKNTNTQVIKDIDIKKIQEDISRSIDEATKEIANVDEIEPKEVEKDVDAAIKEINEEKIQLHVEEEVEGIKNIDYKKNTATDPGIIKPGKSISQQR